jgi:hypothetical protein
MDSESKALHQELVKKFCEAAIYESEDITRKNKSRICGLKALAELCSGNIFLEGSIIDSGMEPVLSALLANLSRNPPQPKDLEKSRFSDTNQVLN